MASMKEEDFAQEFLKQSGLGKLINVIHNSHGNTLAVGVRTLVIYLN